MAANDAVFIGASTDATSIAGSGVDVTNPQEGDVLTYVGGEWVNQDRGGVNFLHQATVTLTDAQIKALPSTAVTIVAEQADRIYFVAFYSLRVLWVADYTNINANATISIRVGVRNSGIPLLNSVFSGVAGLLAGGGPDAVSAFGATDALLSASAEQVAAGSGVYDSDVANKTINITANNQGSGAFTGGNAGNSMVVSVAYYVLNTTTGLFV